MSVSRPSGTARRSRANLNEEVSQHIRDLILSGRIHPGDRLDQDGIALELGVSRLPVREALITLEAEGLVENLARRGSFVASLEPADIQDHYEMYGLLSGLAASRAARNGTDELFAQLEQINKDMQSADDRDLDELNFRFHQAVNKAGCSGRLRAVLRTLAKSMPSYFFRQAGGADWQAQVFKEHNDILNALRAGDGEAAANAVARHFVHTGEHAILVLAESGFWDKPDSNTGQQQPGAGHASEASALPD